MAVYTFLQTLDKYQSQLSDNFDNFIDFLKGSVYNRFCIVEDLEENSRYLLGFKDRLLQSIQQFQTQDSEMNGLFQEVEFNLEETGKKAGEPKERRIKTI